MPTCLDCETPLLPGRSFCGECGTPVPAEPAPAAPTCQCGASLTGAFCGECGTPRPPVESQPAAWASPPARSGARVWPFVAVAAALVILGGAVLVQSLALFEALVLLVLVVVAVGIAAGLSGVTSGSSPSPDADAALMLTDPDVGERQLVYSRFGVEHGPVTATELAQLADSHGLPPTTQVRDTAGGAWFPLAELVRTTSDKSFGATLALTFFLGALGAHWFYLRRPGLGLLRLLTWGGTMVLAVAAISEASQMSYDAYYGTWSTGQAQELLTALWVASGVIALWTFLDLILVATRSVRDGDGRRLA